MEIGLLTLKDSAWVDNTYEPNSTQAADTRRRNYFHTHGQYTKRLFNSELFF